MGGDVDAGLGHDLHGAGVEAVGFDAGGEGFDLVAFQGAGPAFGHLAAAGVSGAEEQDFRFHGWPLGSSTPSENLRMAAMEPFSTWCPTAMAARMDSTSIPSSLALLTW